MPDNVIDRVRKLIVEGGMTRAGLARAAGLHANTLRDCTEDEWNPTVETLGKLEPFLFANDARPVLAPLEALHVASLDAARFHGLDHLLGSIETGKIADLIVLDANPLDDLRHLLSIRLVMKAGNLYDAATLDQIWPRESPFGAAPWQQ